MFRLLKLLGMDKWLWQETGTIDHGERGALPGTQPIRSLTHVTVHFFQNTHNAFFDEIVELVKEGKLDKQLDLQYGEVSIEIEPGNYRTPRINNSTRTIQIHETFLSYQWCITYAIYTLYIEIDYPKVNAGARYIAKEISPDKIEKAREVFNYAKYLIKHFEKWDKDELPNPERYPATDRDYIEQSNIFFTEGMKFILCHEFVHAKKHLDNLPNESCITCFQEMEYDADNEAIDDILIGAGQERKFIAEIGIVLGILSMIFFRSTTTGIKHPNVEDRLTNALNRMKAAEDSIAWAFACVGLELWDEQFELKFDWKTKGTITFQGLYFNIIEQMKSVGQ